MEHTITAEHFSVLLDTIEVDDGDNEHRSISLTDEHEWNLEFYHDRILFENVGATGGLVGAILMPPRFEALAIAEEFIRGDFDALHTRTWS